MNFKICYQSDQGMDLNNTAFLNSPSEKCNLL